MQRMTRAEILAVYEAGPEARFCQAEKPAGKERPFRGRTTGPSGTLPGDDWHPGSGGDGFCNAHLPRELTAILELDKQAWTQKMMDLLLLIKQTVDRQKAWTGQLDSAQLSGFEERYGQIIQEGYAENPAAQGLLDRFQTHRREILAFMYDFDVPFDNNQAERDIRMIKQKVSGTFRSHEGADAFCRIRSYISTVKKNSFPVLMRLRRLSTARRFV